MICGNCGKMIDDNAAFCRFCGAKTGNQSTVHIADSPIDYSGNQNAEPYNEKLPNAQKDKLMSTVVAAQSDKDKYKQGAITCFAIAVVLLFIWLSIGNLGELGLIMVIPGLGLAGYGVYCLMKMQSANDTIEKTMAEVKQLENRDENAY